ncbi:MAG: hypothetical protein EBV34_20725 [Betaproteobacteria bacterium]|nr:hypothetical protein [Betaproteobacteria bacterium]NDC04373.1 hypothetical protein [Betaproteobacteria bacterium]
MSWELYEVMATDEGGHQSLYYATKSLKEARQMAQQALREGHVHAEVNRETESGDSELVFECGTRPP